MVNHDIWSKIYTRESKRLLRDCRKRWEEEEHEMDINQVVRTQGDADTEKRVWEVDGWRGTSKSLTAQTDNATKQRTLRGRS